MKSMFYLIIMNVAVMATMYIAIFILSLFGIDVMAMFGHGNKGIFIMAALFGFGGAFISLFLSKWMIKRSMHLFMIDETCTGDDKWLYDVVADLADKANIGMPEVAIYEGAPNAFATGWNRNHSLVAVSSGLMEQMSDEEIEGIVAHEISHIVNGDMVTMTLMQGVLNTFVIFFARIIGGVIDKAIFRTEGGTGIAYFFIVMILQMLFSALASILLMWFSRHREYKADEGAVKLNGKNGIYDALSRLGSVDQKELALSADMKSMGFVGFLGLFSSHPPIEKRLKNIENFNK